MVTVYGADHPGIVHSVASAIADMGVNVIDVATHLVEEEGEPSIYAMMMEVDLPEDVTADRPRGDPARGRRPRAARPERPRRRGGGPLGPRWPSARSFAIRTRR